ncbi:MAG TPA: hypothetical protein VMJ73_12165 [Rhizomicrobium sp.]|nr:hypothetical protein [Rhizomicrobium sp.]
MNNPVAEEDEDNRRFLIDVERWVGLPVESAINPQWLNHSAREVWAKRKFMCGPKQAPCTTVLKKEARQEWERHNTHDFIVLGFTADERRRHDRFVLTERSNVLPVLIEAGITKADCFEIILCSGLKLPRMYALGYPNANCIGCVKATSATYWNHVRRRHPAVFQDRAAQSRSLGARLVRVRGERIFLDELPEDAIGAPMKTMQVECGIFCEEKE